MGGDCICVLICDWSIRFGYMLVVNVRFLVIFYQNKLTDTLILDLLTKSLAGIFVGLCYSIRVF